MKTIVFILTALIGLPLTVQAQTVFDASESFQTARVMKLGRGSGDSGFKQNEIAKTHQSQNKTNCTSDFYKSGTGCIPCPAKATCNGTTFNCNSGYYKTGSECTKCPEHSKQCAGTSFACESGYYKSAGKCLDVCQGTTCNGSYSKTRVGDRCYCE